MQMQAGHDPFALSDRCLTRPPALSAPISQMQGPAPGVNAPGRLNVLTGLLTTDAQGHSAGFGSQSPAFGQAAAVGSGGQPRAEVACAKKHSAGQFATPMKHAGASSPGKRCRQASLRAEAACAKKRSAGQLATPMKHAGASLLSAEESATPMKHAGASSRSASKSATPMKHAGASSPGKRCRPEEAAIAKAEGLC